MCAPSLKLCAAVAPPGLPPPKFYTPLRQLLAAVKGGARFRATTMADVQSGTKPPFIQQAPPQGTASNGTAAPARPPGDKQVKRMPYLTMIPLRHRHRHTLRCRGECWAAWRAIGACGSHCQHWCSQSHGTHCSRACWQPRRRLLGSQPPCPQHHSSGKDAEEFH